MNILRTKNSSGKQFLGADLTFAHAGRGGARRRGLFLYARGQTLLRPCGGRVGEQRGPCQSGGRRAVQEQAARYMHVMVYGELVETPQVEYAARIASLLPDPIDSVYFVNSGAEAVEGALKLAKRLYGPHRTDLHAAGLTTARHGAMSVMGTPEGEEWKGPSARCCPMCRPSSSMTSMPLASITERTACVLTEPVQGEAVCVCRAGLPRCAAAAAATRWERCSSSTRSRPDWDVRANSSPCRNTA